MNVAETTIARQVAQVARRLQSERTGHDPKAVIVVLSEDTLVVTLHDALTPAEKAMAQSPDGAARVQEFHRQLFANSSDEMRQEINRITGRKVREAAAEIDTATGAVVHAFTTGSMVQVFQLTKGELPNSAADNDTIERADDNGLHPELVANFPELFDPKDLHLGR